MTTHQPRPSDTELLLLWLPRELAHWHLSMISLLTDNRMTEETQEHPVKHVQPHWTTLYNRTKILNVQPKNCLR